MGLTLLLLVARVSADDKSKSPKTERGPLEGTWEHVIRNAPQVRQMKMITQTHFIWVSFLKQDGRPMVVGGGTYSFDGKTYKENYEFGGPGVPAQLIGKEQTFSAELNGDTWRHAGTLTSGLRVDEMWQRVK
jgi:hypothetical protein